MKGNERGVTAWRGCGYDGRESQAPRAGSEAGIARGVRPHHCLKAVCRHKPVQQGVQSEGCQGLMLQRSGRWTALELEGVG